jgi:DNA-binding transcriptional MerR regulator
MLPEFEVELGYKVPYPRGMETAYTISQLAHAASVPTSTVRYYERIGLLQPEARSAGNYRLYGPEALARLRFIRAA